MMFTYFFHDLNFGFPQKICKRTMILPSAGRALDGGDHLYTPSRCGFKTRVPKVISSKSFGGNGSRAWGRHGAGRLHGHHQGPPLHPSIPSATVQAYGGEDKMMDDGWMTRWWFQAFFFGFLPFLPEHWGK